MILQLFQYLYTDLFPIDRPRLTEFTLICLGASSVAATTSIYLLQLFFRYKLKPPSGQ